MTAVVSVIIPAFNYGRYIERAIRSALAQTYSPLEITVVDDGSDDETPDVLARFTGAVQIIRKPHGGVSSARNAAIGASRGEFIALLDGDDEWHPRKIETQMRLLAARPDVGCVGCGLEHITPDGKVDPVPGATNDGGRVETLRGLALRRFWIGGSGSGAVIRRNVLDQVGPFDETLVAAEDWDMWLRLAAVTTIDNEPEILVSIHRHGTGVFRNARLMETNQWRVYTKITRTWPDLLSAADRRRLRAMIYGDAARESRTPSAALRYYALSLREWPFHRRRARSAAIVAARSLQTLFTWPGRSNAAAL